MFQSFTAMAGTATTHTADSFPAYPPLLTVGRVQEEADAYTVVFLQSARLYRLLKSNPAAAASVALLQESQQKGTAVRVFLTALHGEVIHRVTRPGGAAAPKHSPRKPPRQKN